MSAVLKSLESNNITQKGADYADGSADFTTKKGF
jgi:hypothetical protein